MKTSELRKYRMEMEKALEPKRFEHTLGVAYTAASLAVIYGADADDALTAGMLHDCAKCMDFQEQIALCDKNNILLSAMEREENSRLLHAKTGSVLARVKYGVKDENILNAICYHTTGRPGMSLLEKIIYIADFIEPGRSAGHKSAMKYAESLLITRKLAYQDLDAALCRILGDILEYLEERGGQIDPMTKETFDYYARK